MVRDARDGVAHASRSMVSAEIAGNGYYALEVNIMLVSLVLISLIGVPAEVQRRAVRLPHLSYIIEAFNGTLTSSSQE